MTQSIAACHLLSTGNDSLALSKSIAGWQDSGVNFAERLRAGMERKGWDQKALAKAAKLSESAVSRHLEREDPPRADSLKKYADALGVPVAWLGYGRKEAEPPPSAGTASRAEADAVGLAALTLVLRDYPWPDDVDMIAIDAAEADARHEAQTPAGQVRSPSAWRAYLHRLVRRRSDRRSVHRQLR